MHSLRAQKVLGNERSARASFSGYYDDIHESFTVYATFVGRGQPKCRVTPAAVGDVDIKIVDFMLGYDVLYCFVVATKRGE